MILNVVPLLDIPPYVNFFGLKGEGNYSRVRQSVRGSRSLCPFGFTVRCPDFTEVNTNLEVDTPRVTTTLYCLF